MTGFKSWSLPLAFVVLGTIAGRAEIADAQSTSNYIFRFNTGVSGVFLNEMTFASEQPINLGSCTVNEKINGPLACVTNCDNQAVCLLSLSGPPGSAVTDVMELASETPVAAGASPTPSASGVPGTGFGAMVMRNAADGAGQERAKVDAYNGVKR